MNRIAIISDIHGNFPALKAILADIDSESINTIYCLGDLVGYYCMINEVIQELRIRNIHCILGNHDFALCFNKGVIERSKTCTKILKWQSRIITQNNLEYLKGLKSSIIFSFDDKQYFCTHGGLNNNIDEYLFSLEENYFVDNKFQFDTLITGHTHLPSYKSFFSGRSWFNPGSVGQPRDGSPMASYLIISRDNGIQFKRVKYDIQLIIDAMRENDFEEYIYKPLLTGKKIGQ